jgi:diguanylate cyclase (GGDEF)-like protein/PAS domain S-box-containing protein
MLNIEAIFISGIIGSFLGLSGGLLWQRWQKHRAPPDKLAYEIEKLCGTAHFLINQYGRIVACNARAQLLINLQPEEVIAANIKQLFRLDTNLHILLKQIEDGKNNPLISMRLLNKQHSSKEVFKAFIEKISFQNTPLYILHLYPIKTHGESEEAINENKQLKRLMHQAPVGMLEIRADYSVRYCNLAMLSFLKCSSFEEVYERKLDELIDSRAWLPFQMIVEQAIKSHNGLADGSIDQSEPKHLRKYHVQVKVLFDKSHQPLTIIAIFQSISHWYQQEQLLLSLNNYFKEYFDLLDKNIYLIETDSAFSITFISHGLCQKIGSMDWEWIGHPLLSLFNDRRKKQQQALLTQALSGQKRKLIVKKRLIIKKKPHVLWLKLQLLPKYDQHCQVQGISIIAQDITAQKRLEFLSQVDPMTKLYNRRVFYKKVEQLIRSPGKITFTFCLLDIDFFKLYNDTYGHPAGDRAIVAVANLLRRQVKKGGGMAFRLGGEEFALLLISHDYQTHILLLQETLRSVEALAIPHEKNKASAFLTISMGAQFYDWQQPKRLEDLYDDTDQALYQAKTAGRNRLVLFPFS